MKTVYDVVLFDLDGTLTDPKLGIVNSIRYALNYFGIQEKDTDRLLKFIGPPLKESFIEHYSFPEEKAVLAIDKYREYFSVTGIFENVVYPKIPELLAELSASGKQLILATSKPTGFAQQILDHFDLAKYFCYTGGSNLDGSRTAKGEVIEHALQACNVKELPGVVMIGDRKYDIVGAREIGIDSIGVLYGYGSRQELEREKPSQIVDSVETLRAVLL